MENISIKLESNFLKAIEAAMKKNNYSTKTEFIREAIRDKIKELEIEEKIRAVRRVAGSSKRRTTDEELHKAGEKVFKQFERKFGLTK